MQICKPKAGECDKQKWHVGGHCVFGVCENEVHIGPHFAASDCIDWQSLPGTQDQRLAAAKKFGLLVAYE